MSFVRESHFVDSQQICAYVFQVVGQRSRSRFQGNEEACRIHNWELQLERVTHRRSWSVICRHS